jgi:hypothetical protein
MQQLVIDFANPSPTPVVPTCRPPLEVRFLQFASNNPELVRTIIRMARERKTAGHSHWGMRAAFELLRERQLATIESVPGVGRVKLNNDYTAPMARLVMKMAPDLEGFFSTR